ncbi:MAG: DUF2852 domain-containing protein [Rhodobiaceae bacterium]|nr:DUF2852 domain-containing protein [Rhodobiaceae bacterium]
MTHTAIRPEWNPMNIGLMVLGFVVFWPLGLAMLAYILWGDRLHEATDRARSCKHRFKGYGPRSRTGNQAFDEYREAELRRLEEERRKLDEERQEFEAFVQELRRVKDKEEFDRFMKKRAETVAEDAEVVSEDKPRSRRSRGTSA